MWGTKEEEFGAKLDVKSKTQRVVLRDLCQEPGIIIHLITFLLHDLVRSWVDLS